MDEVMKQDSWEERAPGSPAVEGVEPSGDWAFLGCCHRSSRRRTGGSRQAGAGKNPGRRSQYK